MGPQTAAPSPYRTATVWFFSGTGNSRRIACEVADEAQRRGVQAKALSIAAGDAAKEVGDGPEHLIGLVAPAHGFTAPWPMIRFAARLPRRRDTHAFVVVPRGGVKAGPVFVPGMEGTAVYLLLLILWLRGYRPRGGRGLDVPASWIALHPGQSAATARAMFDRARPVLGRFLDVVLAGRTFFGSLVPLALGLALLPVTALYLANARFIFGKLMFADERCNGCGQCVLACDEGGVEMRGGRPYWTFSCESCMRCMAYCPRQAVQASHSLLLLMTLLPGSLVLWRALDVEPLPFVSEFLEWAWTLGAFWAAYHLFHRFIAWRWGNRVFAWTTLTRLYRRYREPGTKLGHLADLRRKKAGAESGE